jgi:polar amino acid transport system substrate-binding protein
MLIPFLILLMPFVAGRAVGTDAAGSGAELRAGSELDFPPYAFTDENGQITGFSIDLIMAVTDAMGLSVKITTGTWDAVWNSLVSGQLDVLPVVAKLPERQRQVDFSLPHTETFDAFFVRRRDLPIPDIAAARGKEIVVMRSDAAHEELLERNFQGKLILVDTIPAGLKLISSGKHDAMLCSKLIGVLSIKAHGITGLTAGQLIPDYKRVFSFAVKKGETELLEKLNQGLLIVKTNGEYDRIYEKWLTFDDPWRMVKKYFLPVTIMIVAIILIAGLWLVTLHRLVRRRTRELAEKNELLLHARDELEARVRERTVELKQTNQSLQAVIAEHVKKEVALRRSEDNFRRSMDDSPLGKRIVNREGETLYANRALLNIYGYDSLEELQTTPTEKRYTPESYAEFRIRREKRRKGIEDPSEYGIEIVRKNGEIRHLQVLRKAILWDNKEQYHAIYQDITARKRAEEKFHASFREKEVLLKEIHHRVKNNLQIIASLLRMQTRHAGDKVEDGIFRESQDRIKAIAVVHSMLYKSESLAEINFGEYVRETAGHLFRSYNTNPKAISLLINTEDVMISIDTAIPCGLIINELISNVLKHAFPNGRSGEIRVEMKKYEKGIRIIFEDNGAGFPEGIDFHNTETLGLQLVNMLVAQLDGTIEIDRNGGTRYVIKLKTERKK